MNHDHLRLLVEIAQQGNFSSVAKSRDLDPSSVSRIVHGVERELGVRLFQRSTRHVSLTEAGSAYLERVSHLLDELDSASDALKSLEHHPSGVLRVTASVAFGQICLLPLIPEFTRLYPDVQLELVFTDFNLDLVADRIDLALRLSPRMSQGAVRVKWFDASYKVCASPDYLGRNGAVRESSDLESRKCVLFGHPQPQSDWIVRIPSGLVRSIVVDAAITASNGLAQRDLALAGLGPALMPGWLCSSHVAAGQLVELLPDHAITPADFEGTAWLLYPNRTYLPARTRALLDFLRARTRLDWTSA
ncbi:LysR family transcriptional regulator [Paraburkholderia fynbosensis]|uniref:HTH-type transcriptional regulator DmlR n=1 Tax=Paraburkholderia fynbosensis TaxID=1200993 RepID=A0A6J5GYU2_9BURK|nr:LysR family transcriptional regulator [Paraburkholderia fynbosensis]CAB3807419.1 HTH-type transcriptional regulator DmlR [Paraburkholderia fynbosensis]